VNDGRPLGQRFVQIGDDWQLVPVRLDQLGSDSRLVGCVRDYNGKVVGLPPRHVVRHRRPARAGWANQHRLVELGQPVLVYRNVGRSQHKMHALGLARSGDVQPYKPRMYLVGEYNLGVQHVGRGDVAREQRGPGDLARGVWFGN